MAHNCFTHSPIYSKELKPLKLTWVISMVIEDILELCQFKIKKHIQQDYKRKKPVNYVLQKLQCAAELVT
jgi:hypothetical protein